MHTTSITTPLNHTTSMKRIPRITAAIALATSITSAYAQQYPVVGSYVDSVTQLVAFSNHEFCFGVMAGTLDLAAKGKWRETAKNQVLFEEEKPEQSLFLMAVNEEGKHALRLHGRSMSDARNLALGFDNQSLRPVFPPDYHTFSSSYFIAIPASATTVQLGSYTGDGRDTGDGSYQVESFDLPAKGEIRLFFDRNAARKPLRIQVTLQKNGIVLEDRLVRKHVIPADKEAAALARCTAAAEQQTERSKEFILPKQTQKLPKDAPISGTSWVKANEDGQ